MIHSLELFISIQTKKIKYNTESSTPSGKFKIWSPCFESIRGGQQAPPGPYMVLVFTD